MTAIQKLDLHSMRTDWKLMAKTNIVVELDAFSWMCVLGALQLATRHPAYTGPSSDIVRRVARNIQEMISLNDNIAILLELGWDPQFDVDADT